MNLTWVDRMNEAPTANPVAAANCANRCSATGFAEWLEARAVTPVILLADALAVANMVLYLK